MAHGEVVHFPDANLEAAVRGALEKPIGDITVVDMEALTELGAGGDGALGGMLAEDA